MLYDDSFAFDPQTLSHDFHQILKSYCDANELKLQISKIRKQHPLSNLCALYVIERLLYYDRKQKKKLVGKMINFIRKPCYENDNIARQRILTILNLK